MLATPTFAGGILDYYPARKIRTPDRAVNEDPSTRVAVVGEVDRRFGPGFQRLHPGLYPPSPASEGPLSLADRVNKNNARGESADPRAEPADDSTQHRGVGTLGRTRRRLHLPPDLPHQPAGAASP